MKNGSRRLSVALMRIYRFNTRGSERGSEMNFTKQQRKRLVDNYDPTGLINKLIEDCDELEKELIASRDSCMLSAVPSGELLIALEFGYKQCKKGNNIEVAKLYYKKYFSEG